MKTVFKIIGLLLLCWAISLLLTIGVIYLICWAFNFTFSIKLAIGIWLCLTLVSGFFKVTIRGEK